MQTSEKVMKRSPRLVPFANFFDDTLKLTDLRGATFGSFTTPPSWITPSHVIDH